MTDDEYVTLLRHVERRLRAVDPELSDRVLQAARSDVAATAREQLLRMLGAVRSEIALGSDRTSRQVLARLRRLATTESGEPIQGITLVMSEADQRLFGVDRVDLVGDGGLDDVLDALTALIADIAENTGREND